MISNIINYKIYIGCSKDTVIEIRTLYASGDYTFEDLSVKFKYSNSHIRDIINFTKWKNIK